MAKKQACYFIYNQLKIKDFLDFILDFSQLDMLFHNLLFIKENISFFT